MLRFTVMLTNKQLISDIVLSSSASVWCPVNAQDLLWKEGRNERDSREQKSE